MDVRFRLHRHVVVDNVAQTRDVDAAGGNIRRDEDFALAGLEGGQRGLTGVLALIAVDGDRVDALALEVADDAVCAVLRAAEHERVFHVRVAQDFRQQMLLVRLIDIIQALVNLLDRGGNGVNLDGFRLVEQIHRQLFNLRRHRRGEHQRLALFRQLFRNAADVVDEAHVKHPVCLVQHERLHLIQMHKALIHQVPQAAGAGNHHIRTAVEGIHLPLLIYAAEDDRRVDGQLFAIKHEIIINLLGEFAGRGEDEGADGAALPEAGGLFCQLLDNRQGERGGFARAGLRTAQHILSSEDERDGRLLNRGRGFIACHLHILQEQGHQFQVIKTHSDSSNLFNLWRKQNAPNVIISQFRG